MVFLGDIGTVILVDLNVDLTGYTLLELKVKEPDTTEVIWAAEIAEGMADTDGWIQHVAISGDLDQVGDYLIQAHRTAAGIDQLGGTFTLTVKDEYT